ncbi:hypothetical protein [Anaplasma phagocytophilum]|uniref:hypothetical protein n=1 Tax=Anaplasma phagocytophilum TaxID=948 RepID=UPI0012D46B38|nr:hypothetical protein [Anaplasma phagocytophilum]
MLLKLQRSLNFVFLEVLPGKGLGNSCERSDAGRSEDSGVLVEGICVGWRF